MGTKLVELTEDECQAIEDMAYWHFIEEGYDEIDVPVLHSALQKLRDAEPTEKERVR